LVAHLYFLPTHKPTLKNAKELPSQRTKDRHEMTANKHDRKEGRSANSGFAKKRVQWLIEHSTSHQLLWYVDSLVLRKPLLRKAAKRYA
jgi:hypothetical protein